MDTDIDSEVDLEAKKAARALASKVHEKLQYLAACAPDAPIPTEDCDAALASPLDEEGDAIIDIDGVGMGPSARARNVDSLEQPLALHYPDPWLY